MSIDNFPQNFLLFILKFIFGVKENPSRVINKPQNALIIRQHNQFGDLLAGVSLFRAVKETYPDCKITAILSPDNFYALTQNKYIDSYFIFDKKRILNFFYIRSLWQILHKEYDIAVTPSTVSISFTSLLLMRISNSRIRIGAKSLNYVYNKYAFLFDRRIDLNWMKNPDAHVSDFGLDIVRPFGITTSDFSSSIVLTKDNIQNAETFLSGLKKENSQFIIGLHVGAGKPPNRWSLLKYLELIKLISANYNAVIYLSGSDSDKYEINYIKNNLGEVKAGYYLNHQIPELAALISLSDLFITNDTGVMHVAGATDVPQISIFGPTNPFNWAPVGKNKFFLRQSELIDDIEVDEVFQICRKILDKS